MHHCLTELFSLEMKLLFWSSNICLQLFDVNVLRFTILTHLSLKLSQHLLTVGTFLFELLASFHLYLKLMLNFCSIVHVLSLHVTRSFLFFLELAEQFCFFYSFSSHLLLQLIDISFVSFDFKLNILWFVINKIIYFSC